MPNPVNYWFHEKCFRQVTKIITNKTPFFFFRWVGGVLVFIYLFIFLTCAIFNNNFKRVPLHPIFWSNTKTPRIKNIVDYRYIYILQAYTKNGFHCSENVTFLSQFEREKIDKITRPVLSSTKPKPSRMPGLHVPLFKCS